MHSDNLQWVGWVATVLTLSSYFFRSPRTLRLVQAVAALVWAGYGLTISARPIIVVNILVALVAAWTVWRGPGRDQGTAVG